MLLDIFNFFSLGIGVTGRKLQSFSQILLHSRQRTLAKTRSLVENHNHFRRYCYLWNPKVNIIEDLGSKIIVIFVDIVTDYYIFLLKLNI
jgi:hypothetical protein